MAVENSTVIMHVCVLMSICYCCDNRKDLDVDHYGLDKLKKRVVEYLAVRQIKNTLRGPILCFVGPPGVGKTSVGRSVAKTLGRQFHRCSAVFSNFKILVYTNPERLQTVLKCNHDL